MSRTTELLGPAGAAYLHALATTGESDVKRRLRARTDQLPGANMQISPEQGQLLGLLVQLLDARRVLEIGVFTGYSALCMAERLPAGGRLLACDVSREFTDIARPFWQEAGVDDRIDLRLGPAVPTLESLLADGEAGRFDLAFIDADKENNARYLELCLALLRPGGLAAVDNVFMDGQVFEPDAGEAAVQAVQQLNADAMADPRTDAAMVPISDGLLLVRKR